MNKSVWLFAGSALVAASQACAQFSPPGATLPSVATTAPYCGAGKSQAAQACSGSLVLPAGTTAGGALVTATGGTTARSLAARARDVFNVLDFGAAGDGATNDQPAIAAAVAAANAAGGGTVLLPGPASYKLTSSVYGVPKVSFRLGAGARLPGPSGIVGINDMSAVDGTQGDAIGLYTLPSIKTNTHGLVLSHYIGGPTASPTDYERSGIYVNVLTADPSNGTVQKRDAVGIEAQTGMVAGNLSGRVWGMNAIARAPAGTEGYAVGVEATVNNDTGANSGDYGTTTAKLGLHLPSGGANDSTAAIEIAKGATATGLWKYGLDIDTPGVRTSPLRVHNSGVTLATIDLAGAATFSGLTFTGASSAPTPPTADNSTTLATTAYVKANSVANASTAAYYPTHGIYSWTRPAGGATWCTAYIAGAGGSGGGGGNVNLGASGSGGAAGAGGSMKIIGPLKLSDIPAGARAVFVGQGGLGGNPGGNGNQGGYSSLDIGLPDAYQIAWGGGGGGFGAQAAASGGGGGAGIGAIGGNAAGATPGTAGLGGTNGSTGAGGTSINVPGLMLGGGAPGSSAVGAPGTAQLAYWGMTSGGAGGGYNAGVAQAGGTGGYNDGVWANAGNNTGGAGGAGASNAKWPGGPPGKGGAGGGASTVGAAGVGGAGGWPGGGGGGGGSASGGGAAGGAGADGGVAIFCW